VCFYFALVINHTPSPRPSRTREGVRFLSPSRPADRRRKEIAEAILDVRHSRHLSAMVFSHEMRMLVPYTAGRGAMGLLASFSKSVWHLMEEWERTSWVNKLFHELEKQSEHLMKN